MSRIPSIETLKDMYILDYLGPLGHCPPDYSPLTSCKNQMTAIKSSFEDAETCLQLKRSGGFLMVSEALIASGSGNMNAKELEEMGHPNSMRALIKTYSQAIDMAASSTDALYSQRKAVGVFHQHSDPEVTEATECLRDALNVLHLARIECTRMYWGSGYCTSASNAV